MSFGKALLASLVGFLLAGGLLILLLLIILGTAISSSSDKKKASLTENSVLVLDLSQDLSERSQEDPLAVLGKGFSNNGLGLNQILVGLKKAAKDEKIKGVYLKTSFLNGGIATGEAIRNALLEFKKSGKFIYSYSEVMTEGAYYVGSVADSLFLFPHGFMEWNGIGSTPYFLKGTFDKLNIEPILFKVGTYKSYGETFTRKNMSDASREQTQVLVDDIWQHVLGQIAQARKLNPVELNQLATDLKIEQAKDAVRYHLVDGVRFEDEFDALLRRKLGVEDKKRIPVVTMEKYASGLAEEGNASHKIAVIYAVGDINSGTGGNDAIGSKTLSQAIRKARKDDNIKAIVLRVNSPGGSALASDVIWREIVLARKAKPVIASYGDVAASGGYYISAACDQIVCEPTTITGSIGVFGLMWNSEKFFSDKLGITFDRVTTNPHADLGNPNRNITPVEAKYIQQGVNDIYGDFIRVVLEGRHFKDSASVDHIAQGRVWSGIQAQKLHLVDTLGGLEVALQLAARKAGLGDDYRIVEYPRYKSSWEELLESFSDDPQAALGKLFLTPEEMRLRKLLTSFQAERGLYMRMPEELEVR